jgi:hypothetical protein
METNITTVEQTEISEKEITNIFEAIILEENNPIYLQSFLSVNSLFLKKSFSDDYEQLALEYSYRPYADKQAFIKSVVDEYFFVEKINIDQLNIIKRYIHHIFEDYMKLFFSRMSSDLLSFKFQSKDKKEFLTKKYNHVCKLTKGYREYLETKNTDSNTIIALTYKYLSFDMRREIDDYELMTGWSLNEWIRAYNHVKNNPGIMEKKINENLKNVVTIHTKEILDMNNKNFSVNNIQKILTKRCIDEGKIPETVQRMNRNKGSENELIRVPTLLPLSKIKEIIGNEEKTCLITN